LPIQLASAMVGGCARPLGGEQLGTLCRPCLQSARCGVCTHAKGTFGRWCLMAYAACFSVA
jgi:hypothetical protein